MSDGMGPIGAVVLLSLGCILVFVVPSCQCSSKAEAAGVESSYGLMQGCMVKVKGKWVPYDRWRVVDDE